MAQTARSLAGLFHGAASLGIAESADAIARKGAAGRINGDARPRMQVADNAIDLAAARGVLSRAAALIDEHQAANPASDGSADDLGALFAEAQAAKAKGGCGCQELPPPYSGITLNEEGGQGERRRTRRSARRRIYD